MGDKGVSEESDTKGRRCLGGSRGSEEELACISSKSSLGNTR